MASAVKAAQVPHVVVLSSMGADLPDGTGPIQGLHHFEKALAATGTKVSAIRAGFFMENISSGIAAAKNSGVYPNMMPSRTMPMPMIATKDIGKLVAELLVAGPKSENVDLHGPSYTVEQVAQKVGKALQKNIQIVDIPASGWFEALTKAGLSKAWANAYIEMYNALLSGRISPKGHRAVSGKTELDEVIKQLV
ncbi:MAG: NADH(P)-binding protein [Bdellovibrio sp.]|nr:MAG: NADH(P)-binding protein [Bdellovibrio sp.]